MFVGVVHITNAALKNVTQAVWHTANVAASYVTFYFQVFKKKIQEFREACYALTGFKIDVIRDNQYRLQSMYAERSTDDLLFEVSSSIDSVFNSSPVNCLWWLGTRWFAGLSQEVLRDIYMVAGDCERSNGTLELVRANQIESCKLLWANCQSILEHNVAKLQNFAQNNVWFDDINRVLGELAGLFVEPTAGK